MSKTGMDLSSSGGGNDAADADASALASTCAVTSAAEPSRSTGAGSEIIDAAADGALSIGDSRRAGTIPKKTTAPSAAKIARHGTIIRPIDVALILSRPWLTRWVARAAILRQFVWVINHLIGRQSAVLNNSSLTPPEQQAGIWAGLSDFR
jgi:hypothetical protein